MFENKNVPIYALEKLSDNEEWDVRISVARNINCPEHILMKLAGDVDFDVRREVIYNKTTPSYVLSILYEEFTEHVLKHPNCPDYLKILSK